MNERSTQLLDIAIANLEVFVLRYLVLVWFQIFFAKDVALDLDRLGYCFRFSRHSNWAR